MSVRIPTAPFVPVTLATAWLNVVRTKDDARMMPLEDWDSDLPIFVMSGVLARKRSPAITSASGILTTAAICVETKPDRIAQRCIDP